VELSLQPIAGEVCVECGGGSGGAGGGVLVELSLQPSAGEVCV
jgi:hypothetical protein